jgi:hypothetical protein
MKTIEEEKRGIRQIIKIQIVVMAIIIMVGGIVYGMNTGKWPAAFMMAITLFAFTLIFAQLTFMAAMNRLERFSGRAE